MTDLVEIPSVPPAADVVAKLEAVLAEAHAGRISSVAIAIVYRDGSTGDTWSHLPSISSAIGAASVLHADLVGLVTSKPKEPL